MTDRDRCYRSLFYTDARTGKPDLERPLPYTSVYRAVGAFWTALMHGEVTGRGEAGLCWEFLADLLAVERDGRPGAGAAVDMIVNIYMPYAQRRWGIEPPDEILEALAERP